MSESNPVEIAIAAIRSNCRYWNRREVEGCSLSDGQDCDCKDYGHAVIAALEREGGFKLMRREATVEMNCAAWKLVRDRWPKGQLLGPGPAFREALEAAWDAAPSYATTPVETAENER